MKSLFFADGAVPIGNTSITQGSIYDNLGIIWLIGRISLMKLCKEEDFERQDYPIQTRIDVKLSRNKKRNEPYLSKGTRRR